MYTVAMSLTQQVKHTNVISVEYYYQVPKTTQKDVTEWEYTLVKLMTNKTK